MVVKPDIKSVRKGLEMFIGRKIRLTSKHGRSKEVVRIGVLENLYPCVFTVRITNLGSENNTKRLASYSYADVLSKDIVIEIVRQPSDR